MNDGRIAAIIVAAGSGERMGLEISKPFLQLGKKPILVHTLEKFHRSPEVDEIIIVVKAAELEMTRKIVSEFSLAKVVGITEGGQRRQDSVYEGLQKLVGRRVDYVLVHDGVRPLVPVEKIHELIVACKEYKAAILAVPPKDTTKQSNTLPFVQGTLDRTRLWAVQTPQAFAIDLLTKAYERAFKENFNATDDASLVERLGVKVRIIEGSYENIKITTPEDLELAELILRRQTSVGR